MTASRNSSPSWCKLASSLHEKVWGSRALEPWFPNPAALTGEVWFDPVAGLLVKFLFTTGKLSVQVHPGGASGKTEMWYILRADPGARLALGFREPVTREQVRAACLSGGVETLLEWHPVQPGQTYFIPPGTVHGLGSGIALCEIQRNNLVTYRLYDYGRPRELHLDEGLAVSSLTRHPGPNGFPVVCEYFETERAELAAGRSMVLSARAASQVIFTRGRGLAAGLPYRLGEVWSGEGELEIAAQEDTVLLRTAPPAAAER